MEICAGLAFACLVIMTGKAETEAVSSTGQWFGVYVPHLDALGITPLASEVFPSPISLLMFCGGVCGVRSKTLPLILTSCKNGRGCLCLS